MKFFSLFCKLLTYEKRNYGNKKRTIIAKHIAKQSKLYEIKKKQIKKTKKKRNPFRSRTHDHKISKTTHYLSANLCLLKYQ